MFYAKWVIVACADFEHGDGTGGESIYPENPGGKFGDEQPGLQLRHMKKGILTMANSGRNANGSQVRERPLSF